ncbi:hypothetical protein RI367_001460 [Sorochytrium milnesiophthora]
MTTSADETLPSLSEFHPLEDIELELLEQYKAGVTQIDGLKATVQQLSAQCRELRQLVKSLVQRELNRYQDAATAIQAVWRGYRVRRLYSQRRLLARYRKPIPTRVWSWEQLVYTLTLRIGQGAFIRASTDRYIAAATRIQACFRGHLARKILRRFMADQAAAHKIQTAWYATLLSFEPGVPAHATPKANTSRRASDESAGRETPLTSTPIRPTVAHAPFMPSSSVGALESDAEDMSTVYESSLLAASSIVAQRQPPQHDAQHRGNGLQTLEEGDAANMSAVEEAFLSHLDEESFRRQPSEPAGAHNTSVMVEDFNYLKAELEWLRQTVEGLKTSTRTSEK